MSRTEPAAFFRRSPRLIATVVISLVLIILIADIGPRIARKVLLKDKPPAEQAAIRRYAHEPVTLQPEWLVAQPLPAGADDFLNTLEAANETSEFKNAHAVLTHLIWVRGWHSPDDARTTLALTAAVVDPWVAPFTALVRDPGYELFLHDDAQTGYLPWTALHAYLRLQLRVAAADGAHDRALHTAETLLRGLHRPWNVGGFTHGMGIFHADMLTTEIAGIVRFSADLALLRGLAGLLREHEAGVVPSVYLRDDSHLDDAIGRLRAARAWGATIDRLEFGSAVELYAYAAGHGAVAAPGTSTDGWFTRALSKTPQMRALRNEMFAVIVREFPSDNERHALARYRLMRLRLAQRIAELEGRTEDAATQDQARLLDGEILRDPFSGQPFLFNAERRRFYSVGPDRDDDGGHHLPDRSTHGSPPDADGDLFLE